MKKVLLLLMFTCLAPLLAQGLEYSWENDQEKEVSLAAFQGKPVILHFWASWCPPCRSEMPDLVKWIEQHPEVKVVMISLDNDKDDARKFFEKQGIKQPLNMGRMRDTSRLGVRGLPSTFIIGADGEVKKRYSGDLEWADAAVSQDVLHWL